MEKEIKKENEAQISFYSGRSKWAFDKIQKILDKKQKGDLSIDLDIQMKIYNQVHNDAVKSLRFAEVIQELLKQTKK